VPSFCYYPGLSLQAGVPDVHGGNRKKAPKLQTACTVIATEGMIVRTDTEQVRRRPRKYMLEFFADESSAGLPGVRQGAASASCRTWCFRYRARIPAASWKKKIHRPEEKWSELVYYDAPRCILCFRLRARVR